MTIHATSGLDTSRYFNRSKFVDAEGRSSHDLIELALLQRDLTFETRYLDPKFLPSVETPFVEIKRAEPDPHSPAAIANAKPPYEGSYEAYLQSILDAVRNHMSQLTPSDRYLFSHSAGYDSRIISGVMTQLKNAGSKSFDDIVFHCWGRPEEDSFRAIMDRQGWHNLTVADDEIENPYGLGDPTLSVGGWNSYSNQFKFWGAHNPKEYTLILGAEGGETCTRSLDTWIHSRGFLSGRGEPVLRIASTFRGLVAPYISHDVLSVTMSMPASWRNIPDPRVKDGRDKLRADLVEILGLSDISVPTSAKYNLNLGPELQSKMVEQYEKSLFFRDFKRTLDYDALFNRLSSWDACAWGFGVTVYETIMQRRASGTRASA